MRARSRRAFFKRTSVSVWARRAAARLASATRSAARWVVSSRRASTWPSATSIPSSTSTSEILPVIFDDTVASRRAVT